MSSYDKIIVSNFLNILSDNLELDLKFYYLKGSNERYSIYIERKYSFKNYDDLIIFTPLRSNENNINYLNIDKITFFYIKNIIDILKIDIKVIDDKDVNKYISKSEEYINTIETLYKDLNKEYNEINEIMMLGVQYDEEITLYTKHNETKEKIKDIEINYICFNQ